MCVNGSLIRSSTWRSSSVSAPCISSSICLPSSPERSRTMRGSFCQALPIGCIRVFMTPSCSSAVTLESRCSGTLNSVSSLRREISSSWLRVSTSSETIVIRCSSVSTLTRIDWLATLSASGTSASATAAFLRRRLRLLAGCLGGFWLRRRRRRAQAAAAAARRDLGRGLAEGALEFVERDFAGTQRALQHLRRPACPAVIAGCTGGAAHRGRRRGDRRGSACAMPRSTIACSLIDQILVGALGLGLGGLEPGENFLDAVDAWTGSA